MGQSYSVDHPLLRRDTPLTSFEATEEITHIVDHLQTSRQKSLAALFQCASEEYKNQNAHLVESGEIDESINNCDSILSSIAASNHNLSDAIDNFSSSVDKSLSASSSSDQTTIDFNKLDKEKDYLNKVPIGLLGYHSCIDLNQTTFSSLLIGDQRVWMNALQSGQIYLREYDGSYRYGHDFVGENHSQFPNQHFLSHYASSGNNIEAFLKLALRGKKVNVDYVEYRKKIEQASNQYYYRTRKEADETWAVFDDEPLARLFREAEMKYLCETAGTIQFALAAYLVGIHLCTGTDQQRRYCRATHSRITGEICYLYDRGHDVAAREVLIKEKVFAAATLAAFQIPPSNLIVLLPQFRELGAYLSSSVDRLRQAISGPVKADKERQESYRRASKNSFAPNQYIVSNDIKCVFEQESAENILAALKEESKYRQEILRGSRDSHPGIEVLLHYHSYDDVNNEDKLSLDEYINQLLTQKQEDGTFLAPPRHQSRSGYVARPTSNESLLVFGPHFHKKLHRRFFLSSSGGGSYFNRIDELHDKLLCDVDYYNLETIFAGVKAMGSIGFVSLGSCNIVSALKNLVAVAKLRRLTSSPTSITYDDLLLKRDVYEALYDSSDHSKGNTNVSLPTAVLEAWTEKDNNNNNNDGIIRLQQAFPSSCKMEDNHLTVFQKHQRLSPGNPCFASREVFAERWNKFSHGILDGFSSPWAYCIGGSVASCLDPHSATESSSYPSTNRDLDIVFVGLSHLGVLRQIQALDAFMKKKFKNDNNKEWPYPHNMVTCATSSTLTYVLPYPLPRVQVILGSWPSIAQALYYTDVDCSGVALSLFNPRKQEEEAEGYYHNTNNNDEHENSSSAAASSSSTFIPRVVLTPRSMHSWIYRINVPTGHAHGIRGSINYEMRLLKYARRDGFAVTHYEYRGDGRTAEALKKLDLGEEKTRMTMTTGLTWLYFVDKEKFKPKLNALSALDVSEKRGLKQVRDRILHDDFVESDGYGGKEAGYFLIPATPASLETLVNSTKNKKSNEEEEQKQQDSSSSNLEEEYLEKYCSLDVSWRRNDVTCGTLCERFAPKGLVGIPKDEDNNRNGRRGYRYGRKNQDMLRSEKLWYLSIGHEHSVECESWTIDLEKNVKDGEEAKYFDDYDDDYDYDYEEEEEEDNYEEVKYDY